jgi:hypothetical protein
VYKTNKGVKMDRIFCDKCGGEVEIGDTGDDGWELTYQEKHFDLCNNCAYEMFELQEKLEKENRRKKLLRRKR